MLLLAVQVDAARQDGCSKTGWMKLDKMDAAGGSQGVLLVCCCSDSKVGKLRSSDVDCIRFLRIRDQALKTLFKHEFEITHNCIQLLHNPFASKIFKKY